jgi:hypothetical protein
MNEIVKEYISSLLALEMCCKDGHYQVKGIDFRQLHMIFDEIINGIGDESPSLGDMRDDIQEIYFLGKGLDALSGQDMLAIATTLVRPVGTNNAELLQNAKDSVIGCLERVGAILKGNITQGENDLFANQARELQHRLGFLERTLS